MSPSWRPTRALTNRLRQQPRITVAVLIWVGFALLIVTIGVVRVAEHRPFGSWVSFVLSAVVASFYAYWLAGWWAERRARRTKA